MRQGARRNAMGQVRLTVGYGLVAVLMLILIAPLLALLVLSFWTQTGFSIDTTPTLANYWSLIEPSPTPTVYFGIPFPLANPVPAILLLKSLVMSLTATLAVLLVAYPMAYFLAFRVTRYKVVWLILITIPFWTSY